MLWLKNTKNAVKIFGDNENNYEFNKIISKKIITIRYQECS